MITTATDAKNLVFGGREGSGAAQVFDSGRFDPVEYSRRAVERQRLANEKLDTERKDRNRRLFDFTQEVSPTTNKGREELYGLMNTGIDALAEMIASGQDPEDPTSEAGKYNMKWQTEVRNKASLDKIVGQADMAVRQAYRSNPDKYDSEAMETYLKGINEATDLQSLYEFQRTAQPLVPVVNIDAPLGGFTVKPKQILEYDPSTSKYIVTPSFDPTALDNEAKAIAANPVNKREVDKVNKMIAEGQLPYKSAEDFYKERYLAQFAEQDKFARQSSGSSRDGVTFTNNGIAVNGWRGTAYVAGDGKIGVAIDREGGADEPSQPMYIVVDGKKITAAVTDIIDNGDGTYKAKYAYNKVIPATNFQPEKEEEVKGEVLVDDENWGNFSSATGFSKSDILGLINKNKPKGAKKAAATTGGKLKVQPRDTSSINGE
jgi:hypothetical protein